MIRLDFFSQGPRITGFRCTGHSGLAEAGEDILCAAVTGAVRLLESALNDVMGTGAAVRVQGQLPEIELKLPPTLSEEQDDVAQALFAGLMLLGTELHDEYPENIEVSEA